MEGRLQLAMITMTDEHMAAINASEEVSLPKLNLLVAEQKLIKAIALQPDLIAGYIILALVRIVGCGIDLHRSIRKERTLTSNSPIL